MISKITSRGGALFMICAVVLFFGLFKLTESPPFWYDEGWYFQTSANLATIGIDGIQLAPGNIHHVSFLTVGYPVIYPLALWFKAFGISVVSARSLMVLFILAFATVAYLLIKRLYGFTSAVGALALLVTFPPLYGNGKSVLGEVPGMFYLALFLLCFNWAKNSPKRTFWISAAGLAAGLAIATKPMFLVLIPALAIGVGVEWYRKQISGMEVTLGIVSTLVPIGIWLFVQFGGGDVAGLLSFYANPYHESSLIHVLISNIRRILTDSSTLYTIFILGVWSAAIGVRIWSRSRTEKVSGEEIIAYTFSVLVFLAFLRVGSVYRYIFPAQVLALAFFWPSLCALWPARFRVAKIGLTGLLCILGLYQLIFSSWVADSYSSHKTAFWQDYFAGVSISTSYFFYDTPEVVPFIHGRNYYQSLLTPAGNPTGPEQLAVIRAGGADRIIAVTEKYEPLKNDLFASYVVERTAYKYSILKRK